MKPVYLIYDDSAKPGEAIKSITGGKSFGSTIFKRIKLSEHVANYVESVKDVYGYSVIKNTKEAYSVIENLDDCVVMVLYSSFIISDKKEFEILVEKATCAKENYMVSENNKIACVIYSDKSEYKPVDADKLAFSLIDCKAFTDISDVNNFRQFITSGFEARFFNAVSGDDYTVIKRSTNIEKLEKEYKFYGLLPDSMKKWFVMPYDYKVEGNVASYSMERFHMADLAIRYVHGAISLEEFSEILDKLFHFIGERISKNVTKAEYEKVAADLYINKVNDRIAALKETAEFPRIERMIADNTDYSGIDEIIDEYKKVYSAIRGTRNFKDILVVAHGDLCFSNILYSHEASLIRLIDPKGALTEDDLYMDPYYDLAKLSHSICGYYDYFNSDLYEIVLDEKLKSHLMMDFDNSEYVELFKEKLNENSIDFKLVRIYECSLFLSMLPLHIDRPKKVYAFLLNAIAILKSLQEV